VVALGPAETREQVPSAQADMQAASGLYLEHECGDNIEKSIVPAVSFICSSIASSFM